MSSIRSFIVAAQIPDIYMHGWDFSGYSHISRFRFLSEGNTNGCEMQFECDFSPLRSQTLTRPHPYTCSIYINIALRIIFCLLGDFYCCTNTRYTCMYMPVHTTDTGLLFYAPGDLFQLNDFSCTVFSVLGLSYWLTDHLGCGLNKLRKLAFSKDVLSKKASFFPNKYNKGSKQSLTPTVLFSYEIPCWFYFQFGVQFLWITVCGTACRKYCQESQLAFLVVFLGPSVHATFVSEIRETVHVILASQDTTYCVQPVPRPLLPKLRNLNQINRAF